MSLFNPVPFEWAFRACAIKFGVPWTMMAGMAANASGFDPSAAGPTRDHGLMQVIESNAVGCGITVAALSEPKPNICCAASLLKKHFTRIRPYAKSRRDLWRIVMFANNMGWGNARPFLEGQPPVTWEEFKARSASYPSKHAWVERMAATAEGFLTEERTTLFTMGFTITAGLAAAIAIWKMK
jgi:membrane-bound lytic murein transglycosylase MltF